MKFRFLFAAFIVALITSCSTDEPVNPSGELSTETDEQGCLKNIIPAKGGTVDAAFSTNCDWKAVSYNSDFYIDIVPDAGKAGENAIAITFPENTSTEWDRYGAIGIVSTDGIYLFDIGLMQEKRTLLQLSEHEIDFEQKESIKTVKITSNKEYEIIIDDEAQSWLKAEVNENSNNANTSTLNISTTTNESLDSRQGVITIKSRDIEEQISITQKGGIIFDMELFLNGKKITESSHSDNSIHYIVSPKQNTYTLKIKSNMNWNCTLPNADWITFNNKKTNGKNDELAFSLTQQAPSVLEDRIVEFTFKCDNGDIKTLGIEQAGWGVTVSVHNGERLSQKYDEVEEGYIVTSLYITGGTLDENANKSVRSVSISGVETIPNNFCYYCEDLSSLSLGNGITKIGTSAFQGCSKIIESISIPKTVTYIGDRAFLCYRSYPRVTCHNPIPPVLGTNVFHEGVGMGVLSVPLGSKPKYKANSSWSKQFDQIAEF